MTREEIREKVLAIVNKWPHTPAGAIADAAIDFIRAETLEEVEMSEILEKRAEYNSILEGASRARVPRPKSLKPVGTGALLEEQQYCYDRGYKDGVKALREAIRMRMMK